MSIPIRKLGTRVRGMLIRRDGMATWRAPRDMAGRARHDIEVPKRPGQSPGAGKSSGQTPGRPAIASPKWVIAGLR